MRVRFGTAVLAIAGLITVSCGGIIDPSKNMVESFSDMLVPQGPQILKQFEVRNNGEYSARITALSPTPTAAFGLNLYFGANCEVPVNGNTFATLNQPAFSGLIQQKGTYCLIAYETIALAAPLNFTVAFSHP
jgi:hypothetical protein